MSLNAKFAKCRGKTERFIYQEVDKDGATCHELASALGKEKKDVAGVLQRMRSRTLVRQIGYTGDKARGAGEGTSGSVPVWGAVRSH